MIGLSVPRITSQTTVTITFGVMDGLLKEYERHPQIGFQFSVDPHGRGVRSVNSQ